MRCNSCGSHDVVKEASDEKEYPEQDKEWPVYVKPESVLRQEARMDDWWFFRAKMTKAANVETKKLIYSWWDEFRDEKYGIDRGLDCNKPIPTKWDKELLVEDWWETRIEM